jgi:ABC-type Fe3+/spermidine/putrescine transport system ATPase subunit
MATIRTIKVNQRYGAVQALKNVSLEIQDGEFFSLLGPSGSGKTTLLRLIAGFDRVVSGEIWIGDENVTFFPPEKRRTGMVFQNYALFPHLNVGENIAYGLKALKFPSSKIRERIGEMLSLVDLIGYEQRDVQTLSGGQQQRVALARAMAPHPRVLLMDEPLSNLDSRLRNQTRTQLRELQRRLGITTVYVTHDQTEALALSDRIAIVLEGEVQLIGKPQAVYTSPSNRAVAEFLGEMNWIHTDSAKPIQDEGEDGLKKALTNFVRDHQIPGQDCKGEVHSPQPRRELLVGIRPEAFAPKGVFPASSQGVLQNIQYEGDRWRLLVDWEGYSLIMFWLSPFVNDPPTVGDRIEFSFQPDALIPFA